MAHHAGRFVAVWTVIVIGGFAAVGGLFGNQPLFSRLKGVEAPQVPGAARTGSELFDRATKLGPSVQLLLDDVDPASPAVRSVVTAAVRDVTALQDVRAVQHPYAVAAARPSSSPPKASDAALLADNPFVSTDRHAVMVNVQIAANLSEENLKSTVDAVQARLAKVPPALPGARGSIGGEQELIDEFNRAMEADFQLGETIALPFSLLIMVVVFAGFLAAGLPIIGAIASIAGGLFTLLGFSYVIELSSLVPNVVTGLGIALCIDYGLLMVSRYREELRAGRTNDHRDGAPEALDTVHEAEGHIPHHEPAPARVLAWVGRGLALMALSAAYVQDAIVGTPPVFDESDRRRQAARPQRSSRRRQKARPARTDSVHALERTMNSAGRTVAFSAITISLSLTGLTLFEESSLRTVGVAGLTVVLVALLVALTLVPPLMVLGGDRLIRPSAIRRIWGVRRITRRLGDIAPSDGVFSRLARGVQRRPALVMLAIGGFLVLASSPVLDLRMVNSGQKLLPADSLQRQHLQSILDRFPTASDPPIQIVTQAPPSSLQKWGENVVAPWPGVASVDPVREAGTGPDRVSVLNVRTTDEEGPRVEQIARDIAARPPAFTVYVTGYAAHSAAYLDHLKTRAPLAGAVVVLAVLVLLFLMTGSVLVPLKAVILNIMSLGATFGVLVWIFQQGHLEGLLRFSSAGGLETSLPATVIALAFGLSMDYELFLLARIKETWDRGESSNTAVEHGLQNSGRIITSAAIIIVIVYTGFAAGQVLLIKEMGVALVIAIVIDATLVRMLLVPATMTLLGRWNWWAPRPLQVVHQLFGLREQCRPAERVRGPQR